MRHTKGPWKNFDTYVGFDDGRLIASCIQMKQKNLIKTAEMYEEAKANAQLIAAAPEMLEALENVLTYIHDDSFSTKDLETVIQTLVENVINKARGES